MANAIGPKQALAGMTVLDVGGTVATGYCGKLFADHGAIVIDVEPPDVGFATRRLAPFLPDVSLPDSALPGVGEAERSALHRWLSTNKRSVTLDLDQPADVRALTTLARDAAVLLDGAPPGELARRGITLETLQEVAPQLVLSSISWFGQSGPYAHFAGADGVALALAGSVLGVGVPSGPPTLPTGYQAQIIGGLTAFIATLAEVLAREIGTATGPVHLDTSIHEAALCLTEVGAVAGFHTGIAGRRMGVNRFPPTYPLGIFACRDGWIGVTVLTPSQWHAFCALLDMQELAHVPEYQTALGRLADVARLEPIFAPRLARWSAVELFNRAQGMRIPLALVPTMEQLFSVDQFVQRGAFAGVSHADGAGFAAPVVPFRLYGTPAFANGRAPRLGEHNDQALRTTGVM